MRKFAILIILFIPFFWVSCNQQKSDESDSPLAGVWELVKAEWTIRDTVYYFPDADQKMNSTKFYSQEHFFVIGNSGGVYSISGTYTVDGDEYTEIIGLNSAGMVEGHEEKIRYSISNDTLKLCADWFREYWVRVE